MRYIITAYKPDSDEVCRGCHMTSYGSDFQSINTLDRTEAIEFISKILLLNLKLDNQEEGYELQQFSLTEEEIRIELTDEYQEAVKLAEAKRKEDLRLKELKEREDARKQAEEARNKDLAQLANLQAKYGVSNG